MPAEPIGPHMTATPAAMPHEVQAVLALYTSTEGEWNPWTCDECGGEYPRDIIVACPRCSDVARRALGGGS